MIYFLGFSKVNPVKQLLTKAEYSGIEEVFFPNEENKNGSFLVYLARTVILEHTNALFGRKFCQVTTSLAKCISPYSLMRTDNAKRRVLQSAPFIDCSAQIAVAVNRIGAYYVRHAISNALGSTVEKLLEERARSQWSREIGECECLEVFFGELEEAMQGQQFQRSSVR